MTNIGRAAAFGAAAHPVRTGASPAAVRAFGKLETQRARHRVGLSEAQGELLADAVGLAALLADQLARRLVVAEIFLAEGLSEHQPVAAQIGDGSEEAERLDAGDPAL